MQYSTDSVNHEDSAVQIHARIYEPGHFDAWPERLLKGDGGSSL
jgi:hypothetical protein